MQTCKSNEDMVVMIVQIISCFNSISNKMDVTKVLEWIKLFSERLIESASVQPKKGSQSSYMERYIFIIELLVTKNLEKIDRPITEKLLKIYVSETKHFSKTIWYKLLKILAHLLHLQDILSDINKIDKINEMFDFILNAQKHTNEALSFLYFMRVTMLLTKKISKDELYKQSNQFRFVLHKIAEHFIQNLNVKQDELLLEIMLYEIDFFRLLMGHKELDVFLS